MIVSVAVVVERDSCKDIFFNFISYSWTKLPCAKSYVISNFLFIASISLLFSVFYIMKFDKSVMVDQYDSNKSIDHNFFTI